MLTKAALQEREGALRSPLALCGELNLKPNQEQLALLKRFEKQESLVNVIGDEDFQVQRAVALGVLWRLLRTGGSSGIVLTSSPNHATSFMGFLQALTQKINPALAEVTKWPRWNELHIGGEAGWALRALPNVPVMIAERGRSALVSVVLGAKRADMEFVEACHALEKSTRKPKHTRIVVW